MLRHPPSRKNRINLEDYDYKKDIENRLLMSQFSLFDVEVLEEILHSSITLQLSNLAGAMETDMMTVMESVDKLSQTGLLKRTGEMIKVDKEMRKYYEFQILKFDDDFEADMRFLQGFLKKLPIHVLPVWYAIPRTSTNIFESIVERYLKTPKIFQRYLLELGFEDPIPAKMMEDVFTAPNFKVRSKTLREKYDLTREKFEEYMLQLEFNFVCCLSYNRVGDHWKEVVTPFHEWREYLLHCEVTKPTPLPSTTPIRELREGPLAFSHDLRCVIELLQENPLPIDEEGMRFDDAALQQLMERCGGFPSWDAKDRERHQIYFGWIAAKLELLGLADVVAGRLSVHDVSEWMELSLEDQALALYRHPENRILSESIEEGLETEKNLREVEKALSRIADGEWLEFEAFFKSVLTPIGETAGPTLEKVGRKWGYTMPTYSTAQKSFIHAALFERFFEAGFISSGIAEGRECFRITPFGKAMLSLP
jgi:predicted transcriptional regulator